MREDMAKVLVLRGRHRGRGRRTARGARDPEGQPTREPTGRGWGTKSLGENFAPLRRFLERSVGRRWDDVYSEICARLDRKDAVQRHVLVHLREMVALHPLFIDGLPCHESGDLLWHCRWRRFHVDEVGILRRNPEQPARLP